MSIEDLEQHGVLLPKEEWGTHKLKTTTSEGPLLIMFLVGVAGCVLTYIGNGNRWTWIGIVLFFVSFLFIIILCDRAIRQQRQRFRKERENSDDWNRTGRSDRTD